MSQDKRALQKLRREAERAKRALSSAQTARIEIEALFDGTDLSESLTRAKFEELNADLFKSTLGPVKQALDDSGIKKHKIDEIVLVGGSTRIPKVQKLVQDFFSGKAPNRGVNPDEAVAYGAAVQAGILSGEVGADLLLIDVTPLTLGIETNGGIMSNIISRNTVIPTKKKQSYVTGAPNTRETSIIVFEGERPMTKDNHLLGKIMLGGFPMGPPQAHEVSFEIDSNGILTVTAEITASGKSESLVITNDKARLTEEQIEKMLRDAEQFAHEDMSTKERASAKVSFQGYLSSLTAMLGDTEDDAGFNAQADSADKEVIEDAVKTGREWLDSNPEAEASDIQDKRREIEDICQPIITKYHSGPASDDDAEEDVGLDEL